MSYPNNNYQFCKLINNSFEMEIFYLLILNHSLLFLEAIPQFFDLKSVLENNKEYLLVF